MALLVALVFGPETHVHQGGSPNEATVVHIHFGTAGHVHSKTVSGSGILFEHTEGHAIYLNAFSTITTHVAAIPIFIAELGNYLAPRFSAIAEVSLPEVNAHSPPLISSPRPRSPPLNFTL
jgi:hypothetical protein